MVHSDLQPLPHGVLSLLTPGYLDYIIVPMHQPGEKHWVCAVIEVKNKRVVYYDSLQVRMLYRYPPPLPCAHAWG